MKAFSIDAWGSPPTLRDMPVRDLADGEILVEIQACGLNFADLLMIEGKYQEAPPLPVTLGMECAGRVLRAGPGVTGWAPGDRLAVFAGSGGLAETGCFAASRAVPLPDSMPWTDAAAFQVAYGTSHVALAHRARLSPGETLLVLGAAGGVGLTAVEIGKLMGARVIAVARGAERLEVARAAGADEAIDADSGDLRGQVRALGGADVVYDPVGGDLFAEALRATNPDGRVLVIGFASGKVPEVKLNHLLVKNISVIGLWWGGYLNSRPEVVTDSLRTLLGWYAEGRIKPHVSAVYPLDRAEEALMLLRDRKATGKVVVTTR